MIHSLIQIGALMLDMSETVDGLYILGIKSNEGIIQKQINVTTPAYERTVTMH